MESPNLYESLGGRAGCHRLAVAFYSRVERDRVLRPLFPGKSFRCAIEEFSAFLAQLLDGPSEHTQRRWWLSLRESHLRFAIGLSERTAWLNNMSAALEDVQMTEPWRGELLRFFAQSSSYVVNRETPQAQEASGSLEVNELRVAIAARWQAQKRLDEAVAAIRAGKNSEAVRLMDSPALRSYRRPVHCGLLAMMIRAASAGVCHAVVSKGGLPDYVRARITSDPALVHEYFAGRTLLHEAAGAGSRETVEFLLCVGADANSLSAGGHTPLYCLGNECPAAGGGQVARALLRAGALVDAHGGVKRCTPLHMAARRGNAEVAEALLECGADIEARDSAGDTPLRRAVNCQKTVVARLLLGRGADVHSVGSKGLTPLRAARSAEMRSLLQECLARGAASRQP